MKIRIGFVSNSSSCSFVIGKVYMTQDQIKEFSDSLKEINKSNHGEGYIEESELYFHGEASQHNSLLSEIISKLGVEKYASFMY